MSDTPPASIDYARLLPGVPLIESPFFSRMIGELALNEEERRIALDLNQKGYAVIDFPDADIDQLAESIKRDLHGRFDWDAWHSHGHQSGMSLRAWDSWKDNEAIRRIACNTPILDLLGKLYGRKAWPFQTLNFPVGTQQHMHTDAVHFSSNPERFMCGVWVALEDITPENGPLLYYPGSHKWPIYTNEHIGYRVRDHEKNPGQGIYEAMWQALIEVHNVQPEYLTCKKGQALIWAANLLHGGSIQQDKHQTRWSQVTHYFFENCAYYTPMWSDPFDGLVYFRRPINILTGEVMESQYQGHPVSKTFIDDSRTGHALFDPVLYLQANPDVAAAGMAAEHHYLLHGRREGRPLRP